MAIVVIFNFNTQPINAFMTLISIFIIKFYLEPTAIFIQLISIFVIKKSQLGFYIYKIFYLDILNLFFQTPA